VNEILDILPLAAIGAGTALLTGLGKTGRLELPRVVRQVDPDGSTVTLIDLGFLAAPILGAVAAVMGDGGWRMALVWGSLAGGLGPAVLNTILDPLLEKLGMPHAAVIAGDNGNAASAAPDSGAAAGSQSNG
jgi:hypothetical protein